MRAFLAALLILFSVVSAHAQLGDITAGMTFMGNPYVGQFEDGTTRVFCRNVWSMIQYRAPEGSAGAFMHLWIGSGSLSNANTCAPLSVAHLAVRPQGGPGLNCQGYPTDSCGLYAYAPALQTEEVSNFVVLDGNLFLPGIDPHQTDQTLGQYYVVNPGNFIEEHRTIPGSIHNYDLAMKIGSPTKIFAANGSDHDAYGVLRYSVQVTTDGSTWVDLTCNGGSCPQNRAFKFFSLNSVLYVNTQARIYRVDTTANDLVSGGWDANMLTNGNYRIWANTLWAAGTAYIAGKNQSPGHQAFEGDKLMYAASIGTAVEVTKPVAGVSPRDIRVIGGKFYLLSDKRNGALDYTVYLHKSADLSGAGNWTEVCHFATTPPGGIARSFEHVPTDGVDGHAGFLYFGLATPWEFVPGSAGVPGKLDDSSLSNAAGQIQRVAYTPS